MKMASKHSIRQPSDDPTWQRLAGDRRAQELVRHRGRQIGYQCLRQTFGIEAGAKISPRRTAGWHAMAYTYSRSMEQYALWPLLQHATTEFSLLAANRAHANASDTVSEAPNFIKHLAPKGHIAANQIPYRRCCQGKCPVSAAHFQQDHSLQQQHGLPEGRFQQPLAQLRSSPSCQKQSDPLSSPIVVSGTA